MARPANREIAIADGVRESRWIFVILCGYLASQAYTVPILPIGPWPVWPGLPDLMFGLLVIAWLPTMRSVTALGGIRRVAVGAMLGVTITAVASYVIFTLLQSNLNTLSFGANQQGPSFGSFEVVRLIEFFILFRIAAGVPYTPFRLGVLRRVVTGTFLVVSITVLITFRNVIPSQIFAPLLPRDQATAGAWWYYLHNYDGYGLGAISYTHAYVAAQVTLLLGLTLHLRGRHHRVGNTLLIVLALAASLVSGSRAGFASVVLIAGVFLLAQSPRWLLNCLLILALAGAGIYVYISSQPPTNGGGPLASIVNHQVDAFQPFQTENLVGRDEIWSGRLANLNRHPWRWFTGWGLGSSPDTGPALSPHMLPLQIIMELGAGMLMLLAVLWARMLRHVWIRERFERPFFWTTIALIVSSATQETFYPVPSTGYFLGFYLVAVAIVLRAQTEPAVNPNAEMASREAPMVGPPARSRTNSPAAFTA
ncbi:MAG: O-antigen ligase family protein [Thermomicrobiales bacterium]